MRSTVLLLILIALSAASCSSQSICTTDSCKHEAENMLSKIDDTVRICDDFFQYACGRYEPEIANHKTKIDELSLIQDTLQERLNEIMSADIIPSEIEPFKKVKIFYQNCMDKAVVEMLGLQPIEELLNSFGGWPVTLDKWDENAWSWQQTVKDLEKVGFPSSYIFELSMGPNQKNTTVRILQIDQPGLGLNREYLINGLDDKLVEAYHNLQIDTAVIFGADRAVAEVEMKEALDFEIMLANISLAREDRRNSSKLYNPTALKDLQKMFPSMNWVDYFNTFLVPADHINDEEIIVVSNETLITNLHELLKATPKRAIANYMMWRASLSAIDFLDDAIRERALEFLNILTGKKEYEPRWKECVAMTSKFLPVASGAIYVRQYFNEESKDSATEMVDGIRKEFENVLNSVSWMDDKTRSAAISKLQKMQNHIGYPNELMDDKKLIEHYKDLDVSKGEFLRSAFNANRFRLESETKKFREIINKTHWESHSDVGIANAYYVWLENSILIPAGILQGQFFAADRPLYMNYGSIGLVIGHEITHGFDDIGRQYDSDGTLVDWWDEATKEAYLEKAQCIIEQYGNYTEPITKLMLNGFNSQGENIADNGGVLSAYRAYKKWTKIAGVEQKLPGLDFTPNQLFWLTVAQSWCSAHRIEELKLRITTGTHSIARFRVIGPLSNIQEFSEDFNCPSGSAMNPESKCKVW